MNNFPKAPTLAVVTIVCMLAVVFGQAIPPLRAIAAILLVLFIPGYAITRAAFPGRAWGTAERILFSLGGSLSLAVLSGLVLNWTPWGLQAVSWTVFLGSISLLATLGSLFRKHDDQTRVRFMADHLRIYNVILLALAGLMIVSAYGVAAYGARLRPAAQFTQLWMLPAEQPEHSVRIGIRNEERDTLNYRLVLRAGVDVVQEWPTITLQSGQEWEMVVTVDSSEESTQDLVASLYRQDQPNAVYRYVTLRSKS